MSALACSEKEVWLAGDADCVDKVCDIAVGDRYDLGGSSNEKNAEDCCSDCHFYYISNGNILVINDVLTDFPSENHQTIHNVSAAQKILLLSKKEQICSNALIDEQMSKAETTSKILKNIQS